MKKIFIVLICLLLVTPIGFNNRSEAHPAVLIPAASYVAGETAEYVVVGVAEKLGAHMADKASREKVVYRYDFNTYNKMKYAEYISKKKQQELNKYYEEINRNIRWAQENAKPAPEKGPNIKKVVLKGATVLGVAGILYEGYSAFKKAYEEGTTVDVYNSVSGWADIDYEAPPVETDEEKQELQNTNPSSLGAKIIDYRVLADATSADLIKFNEKYTEDVVKQFIAAYDRKYYFLMDSASSRKETKLIASDFVPHATGISKRFGDVYTTIKTHGNGVILNGLKDGQLDVLEEIHGSSWFTRIKPETDKVLFLPNLSKELPPLDEVTHQVESFDIVGENANIDTVFDQMEAGIMPDIAPDEEIEIYIPDKDYVPSDVPLNDPIEVPEELPDPSENPNNEPGSQPLYIPNPGFDPALEPSIENPVYIPNPNYNQDTALPPDQDNTAQPDFDPISGKGSPGNGDNENGNEECPTEIRFQDLKPDGIENTFPFSIPFDLYNMIDEMATAPKRPEFTIKLPLPGDNEFAEYDLKIPDTLHQYIPFLRNMLLLIFTLGLIWGTNKLLGGGKS